MTVAAGRVALNIIFEGLFADDLIETLKKQLLLTKHTEFKTRLQK